MITAQNPAIAILGRPNVGKSTLFNLLAMGEKAVTHSTAGTTRDVRRTPAKLFNLRFNLLDTAGIEITSTKGDNAQLLQHQLNDLAYQAATQADILLFILDGAGGITSADRALAQQLHKLGKPVVLLLNKSDLKAANAHAEEAETLGFGAPTLISSAHNQGLEDLYRILSTHMEPSSEEEITEPTQRDINRAKREKKKLTAEEQAAAKAIAKAPKNTAHTPIRIAILGRPNVGKSTLVNALLEQEAMLTGPIAGLTREAISHSFTYNGRPITLVDTPGLRKKSKVDQDDIEFLSVGQSIQAIEKADIIILVVDASTHNISTGNWQIFEQQDAQIASTVINQFKPIVLALNKWDSVIDPTACLADINIQLQHRLHSIHSPLAIPISAIQSKGLHKLLKAITEAYNASFITFSTAKLNNLLNRALAKRSPPLANGKAVSLKFIRQTGTNPPSFTFWGNRIDSVAESYKQFLRNQLADALGLQHIPVRIYFRANTNPFGHRAKPQKS